MAKKTKDSNLSLEERLEQALIPNWDEPYELPENWCWVKLDNITSVTSGGTPSRGNPLYWENGNIPWAKISDISGKYLETTEEKITQLGLENSSAKIFEKGTLLYSIFATIGDVAILNIDAATNQAIAGITCSKICNVEYMYYVLLVLKDLLVAKAKGVAQVNINQSILKETPIPLAPLKEQARIVEYVNSLFTKLDEAKEKAKEVVDSFETRKAAILHKAFSGELTKKWRKEKCIDFSKLDIPLIDICSKITDGFHNSPKPVEQGVPYIMAGDVQEDGINFNNGLYMDEKNHRELYNKAYPQKGDILMVNIGASTGRAALIDVDFEFSFKNCAILKLQKDKVNPKYVLYYLWSQKERLLKEVTQGGAQPFLSLKIIKNINIPVIEYIEQCEIVRILENLLLNEKTAAETAEAVIKQIDTMKKAILARAFRGELGTNDPSEESATELLKQVLAEDVVVQAPAKKPAKRISIPSNLKNLLSNVQEEEIIKLLLKTAPQPVLIQEIMSLSSKKFELMDALRSLEKKQLITKNESGKYSLTR